MKKGILTLIATVCLTLCMTQNAFATNAHEHCEKKSLTDSNESATKDSIGDTFENTRFEETKVQEGFCTSEGLRELGNTSYFRGVRVGENIYRLYPEFNNPEQAWEKAKANCCNAIEYIKREYQLQELSKDNVETWHATTSYISENLFDEMDQDTFKNVVLLDEFLNMYENTQFNSEILENVEKTENEISNCSVSEVVRNISELCLLVPYNTGCEEGMRDLCTKMIRKAENEFDLSPGYVEYLFNLLFNKKNNSYIRNLRPVSRQYSNNSSFNVSKGVAYAEKYATTANPKYRDWIADHSDCTNFVSQIKSNAGVAEYYSYVQIKGESNLVKSESWYYQSSNNFGGIWPSADKFAKFFGVKSKTTNFKAFSHSVQKGSFIAYDRENDGKWNHMAFVTATSNNVYSTNGESFFDFKVAQHSKEYNAWVHSSTNGWDEIKSVSPNVVFAVVY